MIYFKEDSNNKRAIISLEKYAVKTDVACRYALHKIGEQLTKTARDGIKKPPKTGKYYKYKGRRQRASRAGEYPANRTGHLRATTGYQVDGVRKLHFGNHARYGKFLEDGTRFMGARPFLRLSIKKDLNKMYNIVESSLSTEF